MQIVSSTDSTPEDIEILLRTTKFTMSEEVGVELRELIRTNKVHQYTKDLRNEQKNLSLSVYGAWDKGSHDHDRIYVHVKNKGNSRDYYGRARSLCGVFPSMQERTSIDMADRNLVGIMIEKMREDSHEFTK